MCFFKLVFGVYSSLFCVFFQACLRRFFKHDLHAFSILFFRQFFKLVLGELSMCTIKLLMISVLINIYLKSSNVWIRFGTNVGLGKCSPSKVYVVMLFRSYVASWYTKWGHGEYSLKVYIDEKDKKVEFIPLVAFSFKIFFKLVQSAFLSLF